MVRVVAKKWYRNQATDITKAPIFTSVAGGDFRVSLYASCPTQQSTSVNLYWDDNGVGSVACYDLLEPNPAAGSTVSWNTVVINLAPNGSISLDTDGVPLTGWNLYVTVEDINSSTT